MAEASVRKNNSDALSEKKATALLRVVIVRSHLKKFSVVLGNNLYVS